MSARHSFGKDLLNGNVTSLNGREVCLFIWNGWFNLAGFHAAAVRASSEGKTLWYLNNICSGQTPACFHLVERKMGGGTLFPYPRGFLTATVNTGPLKGHTVCHPWAPARSSPLININGHCTKWGHWLLTRGVWRIRGRAVPLNAARGSSAVGPWENRTWKKSGPYSWHMDLLSPEWLGLWCLMALIARRSLWLWKWNQQEQTYSLQTTSALCLKIVILLKWLITLKALQPFTAPSWVNTVCGPFLLVSDGLCNSVA